MSLRNCIKAILFLVYSSSFIVAYAQQQKVDSLRTVIQRDKDDTQKINNLNQLAWLMRFKSPDSSSILANTALNLGRQHKFRKGIADAYKTMGYVQEHNATYDKALEYYSLSLEIYQHMNDDKDCASVYNNMGIAYEDKSDYSRGLDALNNALTLRKKVNDKGGMAATYSNMGFIYYDEGDYPRALDNDLKALQMDRELGDSSGVASDYGNIGNLYYRQNDYKQALYYDHRALNMNTALADKNSIAINLFNIAIIYETQAKYDSALNYHFKCLAIKEELKDERAIAFSYSGIGSIYGDEKDYDKALDYELRSLKIRQQIGDKSGMVSSYGDLGETYFKTGNFKDAENNFLKSVDIAKEINDKEDLKQTYSLLASLYDTTKKYEQAYTYYSLYTQLKDTLVNQDKSKQIGKLEAKADFDKELALKQAEAEKKSAVNEAERKRQRITILFVGAIAIAVAFIAIIVFRALRITRKQKQVIEVQKVEVEKQKVLVEQQKTIVEEKNKDITDSIRYASRIQSALLTSEDYISKYVPEYFILFKPRDIVSGDFYWAFNSGPLFYLACCDCTGHGVPGAFMSLLNISMLNESIVERKIAQPDLILNDIRHNIIKALNPDGSDKGKDGMDCALLAFDFKNLTLQLAAANNPVWINRAHPLPFPIGREKESNTQVLPTGEDLGGARFVEIVPDKMPVGIQHGTEKPFTLHTHKLQKGDCVYAFTDGYADQFGGPKGKKFKYKQLQELLMVNCKLSMKEQKEILERKFDEWKGSLEQIDDVLVIGIRV